MPGKPFTKNDPRRGPGGRPKEHPKKGKLAAQLWDALIKLAQMKKEAAEKFMKGNPPMYYIMAWKYMTEYTTESWDRVCGRILNKSEFTGLDGQPLNPPPAPSTKFDLSKLTREQLDKFIEKLKP